MADPFLPVEPGRDDGAEVPDRSEVDLERDRADDAPDSEAPDGDPVHDGARPAVHLAGDRLTAQERALDLGAEPAE